MSIHALSAYEINPQGNTGWPEAIGEVTCPRPSSGGKRKLTISVGVAVEEN